MSERQPTPDFIIVGASKSGTTSLSNYLAEHPQVAVVSNRLEFFGEYGNPAFGDMTLPEYLRLFEGYPADVVVGEKSVSYLYSKKAPEEIARISPKVEIFVVLRDPVERAYSEYWQRWRTGVERLSFEEAIEAEDKRIRQGARFELHYVNYGFYAGCVKRYLDLFGRERVHIFLLEDLKFAPEEVCRTCFDALKVDPMKGPSEFEVHNPGGVGKDSLLLDTLFWMARRPSVVSLVRGIIPHEIRSRITSWMTKKSRRHEYPDMPERIRRRLREVYRSEVEQLEDIIDRDLSDWREGSVAGRHD